MSAGAERRESRLSQLLQITDWLINSNNNETFLFLEKLANQLEKKSIGSLIALLLLHNQSFFSNNNIDVLQQHCQNQPNFKSIEKKNKNYSVQLLSLSVDVMNHLGSFLARYDGLMFGTCCHKLFKITRSIIFLRASKGHMIKLTSNTIKKLADSPMCDPWSHFIYADHVFLCDDLYQDALAKDVLGILLDKIKVKLYYTGWYEQLFKHINHLTISGNGAGLTTYLPFESIFGLEKLNNYTNEIEIIDRKPLTLRFCSLLENGPEFLATYRHYFDTVCGGKCD